MKKVYVNTQCLDSKRQFIKAGSVVELDEKKEKKLFDLGLVEDYDEQKHGAVKSDESSKLKALLEEANTALKIEAEKVALLEEANTALKGFVDEAITLPKGTVPNGYEA